MSAPGMEIWWHLEIVVIENHEWWHVTSYLEICVVPRETCNSMLVDSLENNSDGIGRCWSLTFWSLRFWYKCWEFGPREDCDESAERLAFHGKNWCQGIWLCGYFRDHFSCRPFCGESNLIQSRMIWSFLRHEVWVGTIMTPAFWSARVEMAMPSMIEVYI